MNHTQRPNESIMCKNDRQPLHQDSDRIMPLPTLSPLSYNSPLPSDYNDYIAQLGGASSSSITRDKGSYSSLRSAGSDESRDPLNKYHVSLSEEQMKKAKLGRCNGSLHSLKKSRHAITPSSPPFGGKRTMLRSRLSQTQFHKFISDVDGPGVSSSTSTSNSSMSSLPFSSHSSSTCNWSSSNLLKNEVMAISIVQRSSSKEVKAILTQLAESTEDNSSEEVVDAQCSMIARIAADAYYQVVISKYGGARILCHIIKNFYRNASIVESCCSILKQMPQAAYLQEHGVELLMDAMECHPDSIHVQSASCQTLAAILSLGKVECDVPRLSEQLDRAAHMFLTPTGLQSINSLRKLLQDHSEQS